METFLYYARAIDGTMLTELSAITTEQSATTATTLKNTNQFLDYAATNDKAVLIYKASHIVLAIHSNASYLNEQQARSRAGGHFFMSRNKKYPSNNEAILNTAQVIKAVMSSAVKAELGMSYINAKFAAPYQAYAHGKRPPTSLTQIQTDNSTAFRVVTKNLSQRQPKQWICTTTGYKAKSSDNTFVFTCNQEKRTTPIIGPNIMQQYITKQCNPYSSTLTKKLMDSYMTRGERGFIMT